MTRQSHGRSARTHEALFRLRRPPQNGREVSTRRLLGATGSGVVFALLAPVALVSFAGASPVSAAASPLAQGDPQPARTAAASTGARSEVVRVDAARRIDPPTTLAETPTASSAVAVPVGSPTTRSATRTAAAAATPQAAKKVVPLSLATPIQPSDILGNPRITLTDGARRDIAADVVDRRILAVLATIAKDHSITVSTLQSGHSTYVKGTNRVSNHVVGRAADISRVDGNPVNASNDAARDIVDSLLDLPVPIRPSEVGSPWDVESTEVETFTDAGHRDHLHIGFDT